MDILYGGTSSSLLIMWQIFEASLALVPPRSPEIPNAFDTMMAKKEEIKKNEVVEEHKNEEEKVLLQSNTIAKTKEEPVESLDQPY